MKVIVIGAGIAGLVTALGCMEAGMDVYVYERAKKIENIGGGILLWPHGIRYLEWLGLGDCIQPYRVSLHACRIANMMGRDIFQEEYADFFHLIGGSILPIARHHFQQALMAKLSSDRLYLNKVCLHVDDTHEKPTVFFSDGTTASADVIIGADGIHSRVRNHIHEPHVLEYTGYSWWGGIIDQKQLPFLYEDEVYIAMGLRKMCILWPAHGNKFMWYLPVKMAAESLDINGDGLAQLRMQCADWDNEVIKRLMAMPANAQHFHLPIDALKTVANWSTPHTTLVGDAAHAMGPILGQGANQAIEDAFVLTHCLQQYANDIPAGLQLYEQLRRQQAGQLKELEDRAAAMMITDDAAALDELMIQMPQLNLAAFYHELIPFVDEKHCADQRLGYLRHHHFFQDALSNTAKHDVIPATENEINADK